MVDWRSETQRSMSFILKNPVLTFYITPRIFLCQVTSPNPTKSNFPTNPPWPDASRSPVFAGRRSPFPSMYWTAPIAWTRAMGGLVGWRWNTWTGGEWCGSSEWFIYTENQKWNMGIVEKTVGVFVCEVVGKKWSIRSMKSKMIISYQWFVSKGSCSLYGRAIWWWGTSVRQKNPNQGNSTPPKK